MPIYRSVNGNWKKTVLAYANGAVIPRIYYGDKLVHENPGIIFESSTPGTYTVKIPYTGNYSIIIVGAGSGGSAEMQTDQSTFVARARAAGASGAYVHGIKAITAGTYTIVVGRGTEGKYGINTAVQAGDAGSSSAFGEVAGGGKTGIAKCIAAISDPVASSGGVAVTVLTGEDGNAGSISKDAFGQGVVTGGESKYGGYGAGGSIDGMTAAKGGDGYVKISAV